MKWPARFTVIRHDTSKYNEMKLIKAEDPEYAEFVAEFEKDLRSQRTREMAERMWKKYNLGFSDANTPLADLEGNQAFLTGKNLAIIRASQVPRIIFVSPYVRTKETLRHIMRGWPELEAVKVVEEERIREQGHGLAGLYNDWRIFHVFHPEQAMLYGLEGRYWYRYPQGENVPDVRARNRSLMDTVVREFSGDDVLTVNHHLNLLALRCNLERLGAEDFLKLDEFDKPINCGVTTYIGHPELGKEGRLILKSYNEKLY